MNIRTRILAAGILLLAVATVADGQNKKAGVPTYDAATEFSFEATIEEVKNHRCGRNWMGAHLLVTLDGKPAEVHLGPAVFIKEQAITLKQGDRVTITASRLATEDGESLVARQLRKNEQLLVLRTEAGDPAWPAARWQW